MKSKIFTFKKFVSLYSNKKAFILLLLVFFASISLIAINFYTIRTTSAIRAYINGESEYSKGQKDALFYLSAYIETEDGRYWQPFKDALTVPLGDNIARRAFENGQPAKEIGKGFLTGRNNPVDIDDMIWLFRTFKSVSFMKDAVRVWADAEPLINEVDSLGTSLNRQITEHTLTPIKKQQYITDTNFITEELTKKERIFSSVLGRAARITSSYLFIVNVFFIVLILGSLIGYAMMTVNKLQKSENQLKENNIELININRELDTFVYSASHDLRSPIASIKGLVDISLVEDNPETARHYLMLMNSIADRLDSFIKEVLEFFRNRRTDVNIEKISLKIIVDEALTLVQFMPGVNEINITKEIETDIIYSDALRIKILLNNLLSNAIKYSDVNKPGRFIKIVAKPGSNGNFSLMLEDNGIGINQENHRKIFDMFFVTQNNNKGSGLGLYIVKQIVEKLKGSVGLVSQPGVGSNFIITLPIQYKK